MNIILGESSISHIGDNYTVLKLDTITINGSEPINAYCVVDTIPLDELPRTAQLKEMHNELMENYYKKEWHFCEAMLSHLIGAWNGSIDSFYIDLQSRIHKFKANDPGEGWTGIVTK